MLTQLSLPLDPATHDGEEQRFDGLMESID
jgi:hypothetical protein